MKNYIKTLTTGLFALTFMIGFAVNVNAQVSDDDATVAVGATVLAPLDVEQRENLQFGFVAIGSTPIADAGTGDFTGVVPGLGTSIGKVTVATNAGTEVTVTFDATRTLESDVDEATDLNFTSSVFFKEGFDSDESSGGDDVTTDGSHSYTVGTTGIDTFFLGGNLGTIPAGANGVYTGDVTFTAAFN